MCNNVDCLQLQVETNRKRRQTLTKNKKHHIKDTNLVTADPLDIIINSTGYFIELLQIVLTISESRETIPLSKN